MIACVKNSKGHSGVDVGDSKSNDGDVASSTKVEGEIGAPVYAIANGTVANILSLFDVSQYNLISSREGVSSGTC